MSLINLQRLGPLVTASGFPLTTQGDRMGSRQLLGLSLSFDDSVCEWQQSRKPWAWIFRKTLGPISTHRTYTISPKLPAFNQRKVPPFSSSDIVCKVVGFASSFIFLSLSLVHCSLSVQHHSQSPYKTCESSLKVREETYTFLLSAAPVLLSSVCMCLFFSSSVKLFVLSTQPLSVSSNPFPFYRSTRAPNCQLKLQRSQCSQIPSSLSSFPLHARFAAG